jgi:1-acyl-sn-glycerol-3-phosphate acyltransferase
MFMYWLGRSFCKLFLLIVGNMKVIGRENVPLTGGVMIAGNHVSYLDPPLVGSGCPRMIYFMAEIGLFKNWLFGRMMYSWGAFPVNRGGVDRQAMKKAEELLREGKAVSMFIEGTRSRSGMLQEPQDGVAMLAVRARVPIVPVACIGTDNVMPVNSKKIKISQIIVVYGKPIYFEVEDGVKPDRAFYHDIAVRTAREIARMLRENGAGDRVPAGYLEE